MQSHACDLGWLRCHVEKAGGFHLYPPEPFHQDHSGCSGLFHTVLPAGILKAKGKLHGLPLRKDGDKFEGSGLHPYAIGDEAVGLEEADLILVCRKIYTHEMKEEFYTDKETYERWNSGRQADNNHSIYMGEIVKVLKKC